MQIREAEIADLSDVLAVEASAFGTEEGPEIVELVSGLLKDPTAMPVLSLLATDGGEAVGHILFTRAQLEKPHSAIKAAMLAPLAVVPHAQGKGVGGSLIREGLKRLAAADIELVFVLGHPGYYPRHGFATAAALGFAAPYPIPEQNTEAWMVQALQPGVIERSGGRVQCADTLNQPQHWIE